MTHDHTLLSKEIKVISYCSQQNSFAIRCVNLLTICNPKEKLVFPTVQQVVIWLILPVVICLSQRLSHACVSISIVQRNCEWLIKTVIVYLIFASYMDNRGNSTANTCFKT